MIHEGYGNEPTNGSPRGANRVDAAGGVDVPDPAPFVKAVAPAVDWLEDRREVVTEMGEALAVKGKALAERGRGLRAGARDRIASHPWQAVAAAVGVGFLLARLARR